ncbi:MAG: FixH family protein [Nitrospiraceae bacterium]|nr:MAG: FixH family protein [Nitrospiraceae bacterium]
MKSIIFAAVLSALLAVAGSVYVGIKTFDGPVTEHPYEEGLRWDEQENQRDALGWRVDLANRVIRAGDNEIVLSVHDRKGFPLDDASVAVTLTRPSTGAYDMQYRAIRGEDSLYRLAVVFPLYGYWDLRIAVEQKDKRVLFEKRVYAEKGAHSGE